MTKRERALREEIADLKDSLARAARMEQAHNEEYGRYHDALEFLMKFVCSELAGAFNHPTSINSSRVIAALAKTSRIVHGEEQP